VGQGHKFFTAPVAFHYRTSRIVVAKFPMALWACPKIVVQAAAFSMNSEEGSDSVDGTGLAQLTNRSVTNIHIEPFMPQGQRRSLA